MTFKEEYDKKESDRIIDKAIEDLKRAKKHGTKDNDVNATMLLNKHIEYMKNKYPEIYQTKEIT